MTSKQIFDQYFRALRKTPIEDQTEHTGRSALEDLLQGIAQGVSKDLDVHQETKQRKVKGKSDSNRSKVEKRGAPDFKVTKSGAMILGYVENKAIGEKLSKVLKSDQIAKYRSLSDNIIITDYLQFIWINKYGAPKSERLCDETDFENPKFRPRDDRTTAVRNPLEAFFSTAPEGIGRAQQLALALATRSKLLRDYLGEELIRQEREHKEGRLFGLFQIFRDQVFHELELKEFADAFAQMLAYGLFLARLNSNHEPITLRNAGEYIPGSFRLIRELVDFLAELEKDEYRDVRWVIEEVLSIVNGLDLGAINDDLSFRHRKTINRKVRAGDEEEHRLFERDPFIYFYEDYLRAYDRATSKSRGVYYTPPPIVNFIVRAIDDILKESFGIRDGLADHKRVTVLDFACGTGTFILELFQRAFGNIGGPEAGRVDLIVREHFLKNIFGFEYLIAPYTIAHLKLSQYLNDQKHALRGNERLLVYLTNTLEPISPEKNLLLPAVTAEVQSAQKVKEKPILVITGNPPYSGHSKNKGLWITTQIGKYREGFPELSKPAQGKWLQDDYVKFIRFAQMKMDGGDFEFVDERGDVQTINMEGVEEGVVGVITNHSWLDNPTFKGMRKSLTQTFNQIYVLDLHGNAKKKEHAPDGSQDQNVFDIEQGVAISLLVRGRELQRGVWHSDFWGKRLAKYKAAALNSKSSVKWTHLEPSPPDWLFKPQDTALRLKYDKFWPVPAIFAPMGDPAPGIVTTHDEFAVSFTRAEAKEKVHALLATGNEKEARSLFRLCAQKQWDYDAAKAELPKVDLDKASTELNYRPFDTRWTIWNSNVAVHRRERVMRHLLTENVAITTSRQAAAIGSSEFDAVLAVDRPVDFNFYRRGGEYVFPAYLILSKTDSDQSKRQRQENLSSDFRAFIDARYEHHFAPEEVLGYIYAILHCPSYRTKYADFLRNNFPRVPFPEVADDFERLSILGWALVEAHLLRKVQRKGLANYHGKGDYTIENVCVRTPNAPDSMSR